MADLTSAMVNLICAADGKLHLSEAHKAGCPVCNPTKTMPELNAAAGALLTSKMESLRAALAEWDSLQDHREAMTRESVSFGQLLTLRGNAMERLIKAVRATLSGDSSAPSIDQEFHNIDDVVEIRRLRAALKWLLGWHNSPVDIANVRYEGRGYAPEAVCSTIDSLCAAIGKPELRDEPSTSGTAPTVIGGGPAEAGHLTEQRSDQ